VDAARLADHRGAPAGAVLSVPPLTETVIGSAFESRMTLPPQTPQSVSIVGSRKRALDQSCPHVSQMRVVEFPAMPSYPSRKFDLVR
jgi:hypothetical protein